VYEPPLHRQDDLAKMHALIRAHPLGVLVSHGPMGLVANTIPFLLDTDGSSFGTLRAHMARANDQWSEFERAPDALVVFQGSAHYVSPSWYATKQETGKVVPTWNYVMVQARGAAKAVEDDAWLARQIEDLTRAHEKKRAMPWAVEDAPASFISAQRRAIVGVEIEITDLRGKWKVSQNRNAADRAGVTAGLIGDGDADALNMAALVREEKRD
jgi:transcriptional regulator